MGKFTLSRESYAKAVETHVPKSGPATKRAEQIAHETGKLNPLVDPAGYGVIRRSLPRLEELDNGLWQMTVGTPMPIETRVDTTGSMGGNVDVVLRVLPHSYELCSEVLPGYDIQIATGIFGDVVDDFVLCRPQFEMEAEKIVQQLTLMVPERKGGDTPEDPDLGIFGSAYLTNRYINKLGLRGYDFTVSDAPGRGRLDERQLIRVFGPDVFDKVAQNGFQIDRNNLPDTTEVVQTLLRDTHAFFLQVGADRDTTDFWTNVFGSERVVILPSTELLPQVQAAIIGLTEATLELSNVEKFLIKNNVDKDDARRIARSVARIPIGAQAALPNFSKRPQKDDLFKNKTDLWPIEKESIDSEAQSTEADGEGPSWL
jgi:hypothetical protein